MNVKDSFSVQALGIGLIFAVFAACGDDSKSSDGGQSGSSAKAGSGGRSVDAAGTGAVEAGSGGRATSGGTSSDAGKGGSVDGEAGSTSEPVGGAGGADAGGTDSGGSGGSGAGTGGTNAAGSSGSAGSGNTGNVSNVPGVPCDVAVVLQQKCNACHNDPPVLDAPFALTTYDALAEHAEAIEEVLDADLMPTPPLAPLPSGEKAAVLSWIAAGTPYTSGPCE